MYVCVIERESVCVCVCVCVIERECVCEGEASDENSSDRFCLLILMSWFRDIATHCKVRRTSFMCGWGGEGSGTVYQSSSSAALGTTKTYIPMVALGNLSPSMMMF